MKRYYKVKYGHQVSDYVSVDELGLQKALYAKISKRTVQLGSTILDGSRIYVITPHYHKYTGWNEFYEPKEAEDFLQIKRDCPKDLDDYMDKANQYVIQLMQENKINEIGKHDIPVLENEQRMVLDEIKKLSDNKKMPE